MTLCHLPYLLNVIDSMNAPSSDFLEQGEVESCHLGAPHWATSVFKSLKKQETLDLTIARVFISKVYGNSDSVTIAVHASCYIRNSSKCI